MIGTSISHYRVVSKIGEGGMGVVYKAEDIKLKRFVALKFLSPAMVADAGARKRFIQEAQATSSLESANICTIHEIDETEDGHVFIAMPFYEGETLTDKLARGPLEADQASEIVVQVARGLAAAHEQSIIHRDIKPANIVVTHRGEVKILDFGLAKLVGTAGITRSGVALGTVLYMSPEQARGRFVDHRTDIWSLGAVFYEMTTGRRPFRGKHEYGYLYSIVNDPPNAEALERVPARVSTVILKCLEKNPKDRYADVGELIADLTGSTQDLLVTGIWEPASRPPSQEREPDSVVTLGFGLPSVLLEKPSTAEAQPWSFVAREDELEKLESILASALEGKGRVALVSGDAGNGKTALVSELSRRGQRQYGDLVVASGNCNAHTGIGDPYLPFREILDLLTGDVENRWTAGALTREHATRLWQLLPHTVQALVDAGPELIDTFVSGQGLLSRARAFASSRPDWLKRLQTLVESSPTFSGAVNLQQNAAFEQYTRVILSVARHRPLLLLLDDLQWADTGSISLLFHLARRIKGSRLLILGTYRPDELALGVAGERHPLVPILSEIKNEFGDIEVELSTTGSRDFVDALLDREPNELGAGFRDHLFRQTHGHPLFTIELLTGMQQQGMLVQNEEGLWCEGPALDWEALPARVDGVIGERIGRLTEELQEILTSASVEGEEFTAEAVARLLELDERQIVQRLSGELDKRHHLVSAVGIRRLGGQRLSLYRFRHILYQKYLYQRLDPVERAYLHEEMGSVLQALYGDQSDDVAVQLARHFEQAGMTAEAAHHLHRAGVRALRLSAHQEAIQHLQRGLLLLHDLPDDAERKRQELALQTALGPALTAVRGFVAPEVEDSYTQAFELSQEIAEPREQFWTLRGLFAFYTVRRETEKAAELSPKMMHIAESQPDEPLFLLLAHLFQASTHLFLGELEPADRHLRRTLDLDQPDRKREDTYLMGLDAGVTASGLTALCAWLLGDLERAARQGGEAVSMARTSGHPFSLAWVLHTMGLLHLFQRDSGAVREKAEELLALSSEHGFYLVTDAGFLLACVDAEQAIAGGRPADADGSLSTLEKGLEAYRAARFNVWQTFYLAQFAELRLRLGELEGAREALDIAFALVPGERFWEADLLRLRGELARVAEGGEREAEAERQFRAALDLARNQASRSLELRAAVGLGRLWRDQGNSGEARQLLEQACAGFPEEFEPPDLGDARELLRALS